MSFAPLFFVGVLSDKLMRKLSLVVEEPLVYDFPVLPLPHCNLVERIALPCFMVTSIHHWPKLVSPAGALANVVRPSLSECNTASK
jgi:hypothetical protein